MRSTEVMTIVGARPQFVKASAVSKELHGRTGSGVREVLVHTGQHYDDLMSAVFFRELGMPEPAHNLGVGSGAHGAQTGAIMASLEELVLARPPAAILVYGDTNSTLAGALVGAKCHVPVVHVEAGLRSFDRTMPEEVNRVVTDHVSTMLLCPSQHSVDQLASEGVRDGVHMVGDVMFDVFNDEVARLRPDDRLAPGLGLEPGSFGVVTVHRANNTDDPERLDAILDALGEVATSIAPLVWPVHPRTRGRLAGRAVPDALHLVEPATYNQMLWLLQDARLVLTDSGGLQKEALWSARPCITMRETTEWVETVECGWNTLVGADRDAIVTAARAATPTGAPPPVYGDGHAATAIVDLLLALVGDAS